MIGRLVRFAAGALAAVTVAAPGIAQTGATDRRVQAGDVVDDVEMKTIDGKRDRLLVKSVAANVVVFFRPQQEHSKDTLWDLGRCQKEFASKPVRFVGIVSDSWPADEVKALVRESGVSMPVLVDEGDALYGKLGIRLHPVVLFVDAKRRLAAFEPFREINYCDRIRVRIRYLLGEVAESEIAKVDNPPPSPLPHSDQGVARRHFNFARGLLRIKQLDQAAEEVQKSLAIVPTSAAYALHGQILAAQGKCPEAVRAYDAALKIEPGNAVAQDGRKSCGR
jgi:tetratricopeptide (TPR) repeat protein